MVNRKLRLIPPLVVVIGAACWLLPQAEVLRDLEARNAELRDRYARPIAPVAAAIARESSALAREPRDWARIARELQEGFPIAGVLPTNAGLLADFDAMDSDALFALLDEIDAAGVLSADRDIIERHLAKVLIARDPAAGFSHFCDPERYKWSFFLEGLFAGWVEEDSETAVAWLRDHIAGGGKTPVRFISRPFFVSLEDKPDLSASLVAAMPEAGRLESLRCLAAGSLHKASFQPGWARIVRTQLPEADRAEAIAWPLGNWSDGDGTPLLLHEVDAYLTNIDADVEERRACILQVAAQERSWREPDRKHVDFATGLDLMRTWVGEQEPQLVDEATVRALETTGDLNEAGEAAIRLHEQTGDERYLHAVLGRTNRFDEAGTVKRLLDRVSDEEKLRTYREQYR